MKCQVCKTNESVWAWQPFGPAEHCRTFTAPGYHYSGYPCLEICDACKKKIERGDLVTFSYEGRPHMVNTKEGQEYPPESGKYIMGVDLGIPEMSSSAIVAFSKVNGVFTTVGHMSGRTYAKAQILRNNHQGHIILDNLKMLDFFVSMGVRPSQITLTSELSNNSQITYMSIDEIDEEVTEHE